MTKLPDSPEHAALGQLMLQALDICLRHDLVSRDRGRKLEDRQQAAVDLVKWALGE